MQMRRTLKRAAWASVLALAIAACGGEPQSAPAPQPNQATAAPPAAQSHLAAAAIVAAVEDRRGPQESAPTTSHPVEPTSKPDLQETSVPTRAPEGRLDQTPTPASSPQVTKKAPAATETRDVRPVPNPTRVPPLDEEWRMPGGQKDGEITRRDVIELIWLWTGQDPSRARAEAREMLVLLNTHNPTLAHRIMEMPFMETHEPGDTGAIAALAYISMTDPGKANAIADHPALTGGIRDDHTHAVALTYGERIYGANTMRTLEPGRVQTWTKTAVLPLSGQTSVTIAAASSTPQEELAERIIQTLTWLEEYLDAPVPTANVLVYYGASLPEGARGGNLQVSISHTAGQTSPSEFHWTRHELVHHWFNGNETWLDEGIAQVLTSLMENPERRDPPPPRSPECRTSELIQDTIGETGTNQLARQCVYSLGERFMLTLLAETGPEDFRKGIANLAQTAQSRAWPPLGLKDVRKAFGDHGDAVKTAVEAWYGTDG